MIDKIIVYILVDVFVDRHARRATAAPSRAAVDRASSCSSTGSHAHHLRDSAHVKPSASSCAAHATVIPSLGSPRSSFFLNCRWLLIQLPSFESSAHYLLRHVAVAVPAHVRLELDQLRLRSQPALSRCPSLRCLLLIMAADCSQAKPVPPASPPVPP